jgi:hypothetical protein
MCGAVDKRPVREHTSDLQRFLTCKTRMQGDVRVKGKGNRKVNSRSNHRYDQTAYACLLLTCTSSKEGSCGQKAIGLELRVIHLSSFP